MSLGKKKMLSQGGAGALVPSDNFNTVLWTGNNTARTIPVGFQPDLIWLKNRNNSTNSSHRNLLFDSVRGVGAGYIHSDGTSAQESYSAVTGFVSSGFSLGGGSVGGADSGMNDGSGSGGTYVGWCWYAPTSETNNDGSVTATIKKNVDAGFSIVKFTSNASTITVGHGINKPDLIILKATSFSDSWFINCVGLTNQSDRAIRFGINGEETSNAFWNNTAPTSSVFSVGNGVSVSGQSYIAYCFHSVAGYQKIGSYTGNGNNTGTVVDTGFTPRFVMIKATTTDNGGGNWIIYDNVRSTSNPRNKRLYADLNIAEQSISNYDLDFLTGATKGFQPKIGTSSYGFNTLNVDYIYLAIA